MSERPTDNMKIATARNDGPRNDLSLKPATASRGEGPMRTAWRRFRRSPMALLGLWLVGIMIAAALIGPWVTPYAYDEPIKHSATDAPSWRHPLGLDQNGRDVMTRAFYGARVSLQVALAATVVAVALGIFAGAMAGYFGRWTDELFMRAADAFSAFPGILLAVAITAAFRTRSLMVVFIALGLVGWSGLARIVRSQVLTLREEEFVQAARALGVGRMRILFRHILPNCLAPVIVTSTLLMAGNILGEAGLSFLGIGVEPPYPSWGVMLAEARSWFPLYWWMSAFPGVAIALTVLGFNLLGDGLRDALDPKG